MKPHNYALIILPLLIILSNFVFVLFYMPFYESEFTKLGVYASVEKSVAVAETKNILQYFVGSEETLHTSLLSADERIHMLEVRDLIRRVLFLWLSLGVLFVITLFLHPDTHRTLFWGAIATLVLIGLLMLFVVSFSSSFVRFHELFFQDNSWQLVPGKDVLLTMFPETFFKDFLLRVIIQSSVVAGLLMISSFFLQSFKRPFAVRKD